LPQNVEACCVGRDLA